ncbi:DUF6169 family protein [Chitinophaga sp. MM2321]|uniref:DUF6169 family protein n=1 Tax=Chitinophaga sp. MM2321 TaxID=3137178 RepID=UPI0032D57B01
MFNLYKLSELKSGFYEFTTEQNVVYAVYFGDGQSYFHDYPEFSGEVLTFGFDRITETGKPRLDINVRFTITWLIIHYLQNNQDKILFFVCDSADSRGAGRKKIFEQWYRHLKVDYIEMHNESIYTGDMDIHCSILLHSHNSMKEYIISSFRDLSHATTQKLKSY